MRPRIFLAGDSGVASRPQSAAPEAGWGQALELFVQDIEVVDAARSGASSRSFVEGGGLARILRDIAPGDLLLVSFGLVDVKPGDARFTDPFGDYQQFLREQVHEARDRGAHPVLVTSYECRVFDDHGNLLRLLGVYPAAMRELAATLCVPVIDLNQWSAGHWRRAGTEGSKDFFLHLEPGGHSDHPDGVQDNTHLRDRGAIACARFVASEMNRQGLLTPEHFRGLDAHVPASALTYAADPVSAGPTGQSEAEAPVPAYSGGAR